MKVLVTGGAGFIGSHVVDAFLADGHNVVVVDDLSTGRASNLNPGAHFYKLDIRDPELAAVFEQERPDIVDHHAAQLDVRHSVADPLFDADVNVRGSLNLLECARRYGVRRVVYASSGGAVYGEPVALPCNEAHPINPICQYGVSKHVVEHYLHVYRHLYGLEYTALRYSNVYGPRQNPQGEAGVVAIFTDRMLDDEPLSIYGTGEQARDFVYVADCARANTLAAYGEQTGLYNIGCGQATTINALFAELGHISGYARAPVYGPAKAGETFQIYLDSRQAQAELGWTPEVSLTQGLSLTVGYFREHERRG